MSADHCSRVVNLFSFEDVLGYLYGVRQLYLFECFPDQAFDLDGFAVLPFGALDFEEVASLNLLVLFELLILVEDGGVTELKPISDFFEGGLAERPVFFLLVVVFEDIIHFLKLLFGDGGPQLPARFSPMMVGPLLLQLRGADLH